MQLFILFRCTFENIEIRNFYRGKSKRVTLTGHITGMIVQEPSDWRTHR